VNADTLATDSIIPQDEYRRRFDPEFGIGSGQQDDTAMQICDGFGMHDSSTSNGLAPTHAYDARQERAASDNACAVQRNQKLMDRQTLSGAAFRLIHVMISNTTLHLLHDT
jgi:hypothetical protein